MKVHIGPYVKWFGPFQAADLLKHVGVSEDRCFAIGEWLSEMWIGEFLEWIHSKQTRTVKVHIDNYDTWSADNTLALIVLPILRLLKEHKHGSPFVDDEDVPDEIKSTSSTPPKEDEWETDQHFHKRWDYVLDQMIWAFEHLVPEGEDWEAQFFKGTYDREGHIEYSKRIDNGLRLFGKYYRGLWT